MKRWLQNYNWLDKYRSYILIVNFKFEYDETEIKINQSLLKCW